MRRELPDAPAAVLRVTRTRPGHGGPCPGPRGSAALVGPGVGPRPARAGRVGDVVARVSRAVALVDLERTGRVAPVVRPRVHEVGPGGEEVRLRDVAVAAGAVLPDVSD